MATRADVIADISHADNAVEVYFSSRATTKLSEQVLEDGRKKELQGIPILVLNQDGTTREVVQNIVVFYDANDNELSAEIIAPRYKNWAAPTPGPDSNHQIALYFDAQVSAGAIKDYALLRNGTVELADGKKGAEVKITNNDDSISYILVSTDDLGPWTVALANE